MCQTLGLTLDIVHKSKFKKPDIRHLSQSSPVTLLTWQKKKPFMCVVLLPKTYNPSKQNYLPATFQRRNILHSINHYHQTEAQETTITKEMWKLEVPWYSWGNLTKEHWVKTKRNFKVYIEEMKDPYSLISKISGTRGAGYKVGKNSKYSFQIFCKIALTWFMKNKKILWNGRRKKNGCLWDMFNTLDTQKSHGWPNLLSKEKHLTSLDTTIAYNSNCLNKSCYKISEMHNLSCILFAH